VGPIDYGELQATIWAYHIYAFVKYQSSREKKTPVIYLHS